MENKVIYGIEFPTPEAARKRTKEQIEKQIQEELIDILNKMDKSTTYSIEQKDLSIPIYEALLNLGYKITLTNELYQIFKISWE